MNYSRWIFDRVSGKRVKVVGIIDVVGSDTPLTDRRMGSR